MCVHSAVSHSRLLQKDFQTEDSWHVKFSQDKYHMSPRKTSFFIVAHNGKTYYTLRESVRNIYKLRKVFYLSVCVVYHTGENTEHIEL
jgi:hypothetical protein